MSILICFFPNNLVKRFDMVKPISKKNVLQSLRMQFIFLKSHTLHKIRKFYPLPRQFRQKHNQLRQINPLPFCGVRPIWTKTLQYKTFDLHENNCN